MSAIRKFLIAFGFRSPKWRSVRKSYLSEFPECAVCGTKKHLNVHHILPFHLRPDLELAWHNLITLCEGATKCHLLVGHLGDYSAYNPSVVADAKAWGARVRARRYE